MTPAQPTLFDPPPAAPPTVKRRTRHRTATTSSDAYHDTAHRHPTARARVLETLRAWGPMTRHELAAATGLPLSSVCGRVNELVEAGLARDRIEAGRRVVKDGRHVVEATFQALGRDHK